MEERSLLQHPFYKAWTQGTLPVESLQEYARQYYHFELAFPRFLSAIHTRADSPHVRQLLLDNLWDEEHGERNHPVLWLEFAGALGLSTEDVIQSTPNAATGALIDHFSRACREAPVSEALATLFAYEGQVPAIAWQKIKVSATSMASRPSSSSSSRCTSWRTSRTQERRWTRSANGCRRRCRRGSDRVGLRPPAGVPRRLLRDGGSGLMAEPDYRQSEAFNTSVRLAASVGRLKVGSNLKAAADAQAKAFEQAGMAAALIAEASTREGPPRWGCIATPGAHSRKAGRG